MSPEQIVGWPCVHNKVKLYRCLKITSKHSRYFTLPFILRQCYQLMKKRVTAPQCAGIDVLHYRAVLGGNL